MADLIASPSVNIEKGYTGIMLMPAYQGSSQSNTCTLAFQQAKCLQMQISPREVQFEIAYTSVPKEASLVGFHVGLGHSKPGLQRDHIAIAGSSTATALGSPRCAPSQ